ncbi:TPA: funZ protein, partial [Escherichia coli]|nr:funZ protein [Escherichia coli]
LNNEFFPNIKDSPGSCRYVLLIRPDIFESISLHNPNAKIRDNAIVLNWNTNYDSHRRSSLFSAVDKMISTQCEGEDFTATKSWDYYFRWDAKTLEFALPSGQMTSFISFLRLSYHRPRDIFTMLQLLKANSTDNPEKKFFSLDDFNSQSFQRDYSNYLLGEIKD